MKSFKRFALLSILPLALVTALFAETSPILPLLEDETGWSQYLLDSDRIAVQRGIPENAEIRRARSDFIFGSVAAQVTHRDEIIPADSCPFRVLVSTQTTDQFVYLLFLNEAGGQFPISGQGSFVVKRDRASGRFLQAKVFLRNSSGCYFRIYPDGSRCRLEVYLYGQRIYADVVLPLAFERILVQPLRETMGAARGVDWSLFTLTPDSDEFAALRETVADIRVSLPGLREVEDGAMDENGRYVFIATGNPQPAPGGLNCSGFAKWVVDGLFLSRGLPALSVAPLRDNRTGEGSSWDVRWDADRSPRFGLDWTRNLALESARRLEGRSGADPEDVDVRSVPFFAYFQDSGYALQSIEAILYLLASRDPGRLYLGSVNREAGSDPILHQHLHVVVLFPYFEADGRFRIAVFEKGRETTIASLHERYTADYIHLVRLSATSGFTAP